MPGSSKGAEPRGRVCAGWGSLLSVRERGGDQVYQSWTARQPQKLGGGLWARALPQRAGHRAFLSGSEDPGTLADKGGGQGGCSRPGLPAPPG